MNKENNRLLLKGALGGAFAMFLIMGAIGAFLFLTNGRSEKVNGSGDIVSSRVQKKIGAINSLINDAYLYDEKIDQNALAEGLMKGYVLALNDPYSEYYDKKATADLQESTQGEYSGIGAVLSQNMETKVVTITNVYEDSPAKEAGVKDKDVIYKVNGKDVLGKTLTEIVSEIKGKEGTKVDLTLLRGEEAEEVTVTATRRKIKAETVSYEMKEGKIGYIKVTEFDAVTYDQYQQALEDLESQGMKGLVVDLRNNPGGSLKTVCDILDLMLPKGTIVYTEDKNGSRQTSESDEEHQFNKPLTVLVNGYSASASEIYAGAIQDYGLGQIVGTTTYGKGVVQQIFDLGDGTAMKLTISEYFTPKGRNINGSGITPDTEVEYQKDEANENADNQLDAAIKILEEM